MNWWIVKRRRSIHGQTLGDNLVANPSVEFGDTDPDSWFYSLTGTEWVDGQGHSGSKAVRLNVASATDAVAVRNRPSLQADMVATLRRGARFCVDAVYSADGLIWLLGVQGWVIETMPAGTRLVEKGEASTDADRETAAICQ